MTLWEESEGGVRWDAPVAPDSLLDGLVHDGSSPTGVVPEWSRQIPGEIPAVVGTEHAA